MGKVPFRVAKIGSKKLPDPQSGSDLYRKMITLSNVSLIGCPREILNGGQVLWQLWVEEKGGSWQAVTPHKGLPWGGGKRSR